MFAELWDTRWWNIINKSENLAEMGPRIFSWSAIVIRALLKDPKCFSLPRFLIPNKVLTTQSCYLRYGWFCLLIDTVPIPSPLSLQPECCKIMYPPNLNPSWCGVLNSTQRLAVKPFASLPLTSLMGEYCSVKVALFTNQLNSGFCTLTILFCILDKSAITLKETWCAHFLWLDVARAS